MFPNHFEGMWGRCGWKTCPVRGPDRIVEILVVSFLGLSSGHRWPTASGWDISSTHLRAQRCCSGGICALQPVAGLALPAEQRLRLKAERKLSYQHVPRSVYRNGEERAMCLVFLSQGDKNEKQNDYLAVHTLVLLQDSLKLA